MAKVENAPEFIHGNTFAYFVSILNTITNSADEFDLRKKMELLKKSGVFANDYFFGFGGSHMWLKQIGGSKKRLVIVEF